MEEEIRKTVADGHAVFSATVKDITKLKRAEEALWDSEERYRTLFEESRDAVFITAREGRLIDANPFTLDLFGYTREEIIGLDAREFYAHPDDRNRFQKEIEQKGFVRDYELKLRKKDGTEMDCLVTSTMRRANDGSILGYQGIIRDITKLKQVEEALQKERDYMKKLNDSIWDVIFTVKMPERVIEYANRSIKSVFGYDAEECVGKTTAFLYPDEKEFVDFGNGLRSAIEKGKDVLHTEQSLKRINGEVFPAEITTTFFNENGKITQVISVIRDITERKQVEEAVKRSSEFSETVLNSMNDAISVINVHDYRIVRVNNAFLQRHGLKEEAVIGKTCYEITHHRSEPCTPPDDTCPLQNTVTSGEHAVTEHVHYSKDSEKIYVEVSTSPVKDENGKVVQVVHIAHNITGRKRAEERERQTREELHLSGRLAAIGELAAGVAHEINNPLTGIIGFSERLMRKSADEGTKRDLETIHGEARRAARVVENLLTFARHRESKKKFSGINDILQKALELRAYELRTSNIEVITDLVPSLPKIMADFYQIQEVFLNIIINAEQVMVEANGGGKLSIKTLQIKDYIRTSFTDDGPGISAEHLNKLFDPFFTTRREHDGTGLGLSICHGIVTEHGGRIYAKSRPGKGAGFFVELPLPIEKIGKSEVAKEEFAD